MKWRERAALSIREVMTDHPNVTGPALMTLLRNAYPFGGNHGFALRVWRSEVRYQLGVEQRPKHWRSR